MMTHDQVRPKGATFAKRSQFSWGAVPPGVAAKGTFKSCISGNKLSISTLGFRQLARKASPSQKQALARVSVARQS